MAPHDDDDAALRRALLSAVLAELSSRGGTLVCPSCTPLLAEHVLLRREL